jgi:hypothetical protein
MSTANIISIEPVNDIGSELVARAIGVEFAAAELAAPSAIDVTFKVRGGTLTYRYDDPLAVADILAGGDAAQYSGTRV